MKTILLCALVSIIMLSAISQPFKSFKVEVYGKGTPVILIPGYSCSGDVWKETVAHLSNKYECHVLTLAGFAGVPAIEGPMLQAVHNELISYVKTKGLQKPVLIGHSMGAFMSLWVSSSVPDIFGKIICVDGLPFISAVNNPAANAELLKKDPNYNIEAVVKNFESLPDSGFIDRTAKAMIWQVNDTSRARQIATWQYKSSRRALGTTIIEMATTDLRTVIARITQPVLVLGSVYDTKEKSVEVIGSQYKNLPKAIIKIASSKHFIMYDQPEWMYNEIDTFLSN